MEKPSFTRPSPGLRPASAIESWTVLSVLTAGSLITGPGRDPVPLSPAAARLGLTLRCPPPLSRHLARTTCLRDFPDTRPGPGESCCRPDTPGRPLQPEPFLEQTPIVT